MKRITAALIGAGQRGMGAYAPYALEYPNEIEFIAVAETDPERRKQFSNMHNIPEKYIFSDWKYLLDQEKMADVILVCTQDDMHFKPTIKALEMGYHVLLEKPVSNNPLECIKMEEAAEKFDRHLIVCHVLRYTSFFSTIKQLLDEGKIGDLVSIQHIERVAYWHQAHSFVRGNWRNTAESSPMILAKSCHDMDILHWMIGKDCISLSSFGSLSHFKEENAPEGAPQRCLDGCSHRDECPFFAPSIYIDWKDDWQADVLRAVVSNDTSNEALLAALKTGPYGRCVYHCDNDVVDHQVVNMEFEEGITVAFTMSAFTVDGGRGITLMGTKGQIRGDMEKNEIEVADFLTGTRQLFKLKDNSSGHGGGDFGIMKDFIRLINDGKSQSHISTIGASVQSHLMAFAAETSRLDRKVINLAEYASEWKS